MNMIPYLADFFYNQFTGWEMKMDDRKTSQMLIKYVVVKVRSN